MNKVIFLITFFFISKVSFSQQARTIFSFSEIPEIKQPDFILFNDSILLSGCYGNGIIRIGKFDFVSEEGKDFDIELPDSLEFDILKYFENENYVLKVKSKLNKTEYYFSVNFNTKQTTLKVAAKFELSSKQDICFFGFEDSLKVIAYKNKKTKEIVFEKYFENVFRERIAFNIQEEVEKNNSVKYLLNKFSDERTYAIDDNKIQLKRASENKKIFLQNDKVVFVNDYELRNAEVLSFDLKNKKIEYIKINRDLIFCDKEPNGKFYGNSTYNDGILFTQIYCRHNCNLFIHNTSTGSF